MTFYFVYNKEYIVDRNEYMKKYTNNKNKNILKGSPILVNIEGSYVYLDSLQYMLHHKSEKYKRFFLNGLETLGMQHHLKKSFYVSTLNGADNSGKSD
jgi:hypothetical protein